MYVETRPTEGVSILGGTDGALGGPLNTFLLRPQSRLTLAQAPHQCGSCTTTFASQNSFRHPSPVGRAVVLIRKATSEDANGILACLSAAFEEYRDSYTSGAFADTVLTPETIAKRLQEMTVFVAIEKSGEIVGTIACGVVDAEEGHIRGMAVLPASQGTGIAARLLMRAESHFREGNYTRISLDTTSPLARAIRLYERFGFAPSGKIQDFFGMPLMEYVKTI